MKPKQKSKADRLAAYSELASKPGFLLLFPRAHRAFLEGKRTRIGSTMVIYFVLIPFIGFAVILMSAVPSLPRSSDSIWGWLVFNCALPLLLLIPIIMLLDKDRINERLSLEGWIVPGEIIQARHAVYRGSDGKTYTLTLKYAFSDTNGNRIVIDYLLLSSRWDRRSFRMAKAGCVLAVLYVDKDLHRIM